MTSSSSQVKTDEFETWASFSYTLLLNVMGGLAFLVGFEALRNLPQLRGMFQTPTVLKFQQQHRRLIFVKDRPEYPKRVLSWLWFAARISDKEVFRLVGLDGFLVIRFCRLGFKITLFTSLWGAVVLCPIFATGGVNSRGPAVITIGNLQDGSPRMWAVVVTAWLFALQVLRLLRDEYKRIASLRSDFLVHGDPGFDIQAQYTAMVEYIPVELRRSDALRDFFRALFFGQVDSASVAQPLGDLPKVIKRRNALVLQLEKAHTQRIVSGVEPLVKVPRQEAKAFLEKQSDAEGNAQAAGLSAAEAGAAGGLDHADAATPAPRGSGSGGGSRAGAEGGSGGNAEHSAALPESAGCCGRKVQLPAVSYLEAKVEAANKEVVVEVAKKRDEFGLPPLHGDIGDPEPVASTTQPMHAKKKSGEPSSGLGGAKARNGEARPSIGKEGEAAVSSSRPTEKQQPVLRAKVIEMRSPLPMPPLVGERRAVTEPAWVGMDTSAFAGSSRVPGGQGGAADGGGGLGGGGGGGALRRPDRKRGYEKMTNRAQSLPTEPDARVYEFEMDDSSLDRLTSEEEEHDIELLRRREARVDHFFAAIQRVVRLLRRESSHEDRSTRYMLQQVVAPGVRPRDSVRSAPNINVSITVGALTTDSVITNGGGNSPHVEADGAASSVEGTATAADRPEGGPLRRRRSSADAEDGSVATATAMLEQPTHWHAQSHRASTNLHGDDRYGQGIGLNALSLRNIAIFFLSGLLEGLDSLVDELQMIFVGRSGSAGFVTFQSLSARAAACQEQLVDKPGVLRVTPAPEPNDLIWGNVTRSHTQIRHRRFVTNVLATIGVLLWSFVIGGIQKARQWLLDNWQWLNDWSQSSNFAKALVTNVLPSLVLLTIITLLTPLFQVVAHVYEGYKAQSQVQMAMLTRLFFYQVANVYVLITLSSIASVLGEIVQSPSALWSALGEQVPNVSVYVCSILLAKTFVGLGMELTKPGMLFVFGVRNLFMDRKYITPRDKRRGMYQALYAYYPVIFTGSEMVFLFALVYQCIAPLVSFVSCFYFLAAEMCYKHNLLFLYMPLFQTGGLMWPKLFWTVILASIAGQLALTGYLALRNAWHMFWVLLPLPFVTVYYGQKYASLYHGILTRVARNKGILLERHLQHELNAPEKQSSRAAAVRGGQTTRELLVSNEDADDTSHARGGSGGKLGQDDGSAGGQGNGDDESGGGSGGDCGPQAIYANFSRELYTQPPLKARWMTPELDRPEDRDEEELQKFNFLIGDEEDNEGALRGKALLRQATFVRHHGGQSSARGTQWQLPNDEENEHQL